MNTVNNKLIEALKTRTEQMKNRRPLTPEEVRERLRNSEHFKKLVEAFKKKEE